MGRYSLEENWEILKTFFQSGESSTQTVRNLAKKMHRHPRSCDLTPLDYFLWGAVKDKCYANHPETIQDLKYEIQVADAAIRPETIEKVLQNWVDRISYCKLSRGGHLSEIVVHK